ncbi:Lnb N-terminal periplasmic domain-containing protein [Adhaeribacter rhizoryzae]|uniref:DUF4105 domain-containing protein n=1 Tax=Adhaeribacter rhizoryzae TaxID=2607907 RepID=A0A5M6DJJ0_9BACT|nr:DUF4105 domain-containing protein [Adhaeribacter rhizoryzae]KAA5546536.1 DUF4105 domain-containing protein [Adhaeribacter rhizoryzae]
MRIKALCYTFICLTFCFFLSLLHPAKALDLSPQAQISLITVSPGEELYSMYGHSAIRIYDPTMALDIVFNYGTFDFNTSNFYVKFIRGKLPYNLSMNYYENLKQGAIQENRSVYEQVFDLSPTEKQRVFALLETNYLPQNRAYFYDFFYDNCATRIRDVFMNGIGNNLNFKHKPQPEAPTFRQLVDIYQRPHPWVDLGIDLLMGLPADKLATPLQQMFLPDFLMEGFAPAQVTALIKPAQAGGQAAAGRPLVSRVQQVYKAPASSATPTKFTPTIFFWILCAMVAVITFLQIRKKVARHGIDVLLFGLAGLLGILLTFLWFGTDHQTFGNNLNLLWAFPLHLPLAFMLLGRQLSPFVKNYFLVFSVLLVLIALIWKIFPQDFHPAVLPIVIMLALRAWYIAKAAPKLRKGANPYK